VASVENSQQQINKLLVVQCFTSPPTQYRLYGRPNQQYQSTEGRSTKDKANNENN